LKHQSFLEQIFVPEVLEILEIFQTFYSLFIFYENREKNSDGFFQTLQDVEALVFKLSGSQIFPLTSFASKCYNKKA